MASRLKLSNLLRMILGTGNVYYQPPESKKLEYPCIIYKLVKKDAVHADNRKYLKYDIYQVTYVDRNTESEIPDEIGEIPYSEFRNTFVKDGLAHWVYEISVQNTNKGD